MQRTKKAENGGKWDGFTYLQGNVMITINRKLASVAVFLGGILSVNAALAADTVKLRLDWTPWGVHAPFHLAAAKGWFAQYDLDVQIDDGNGSVTTVQIVGNGEYDLGHASLAPMAIARAKGLSIRAIAGFAQQNDIGLLVPVDSGLKSPADLKGKKIAYTAGSLETPFLDRFLAAGGLTRNDVELINVDAAAKGGTYMAGRSDGAFSSAPFFLAVVKAQRPSSNIRFADFGLQFPSFGLFATEEKLQEKGAAIRRLASVVAGSWAYIIAGHQDEAVDAILAARPQAKLNPTVIRDQIATLESYFYTPATRGKPFGVMAGSDWETALTTLADGGLIPAGQKADAYFTNDMLDPAIIEALAKGGK